MTSFSSIGPSQLQALRSFRDVAGRVGVSFVMIGAGARLVAREHGLYGTDVLDVRATGDFDFGVQVRSWKEYGELVQALGKEFEETGDFRFRHRSSQVEIDFIPFGGVEEEGRVHPPRGGQGIAALGFAEALENALEVDLDGLRLQVANEPGIMILKFFAFRDRNESKDLRDIWEIMSRYAVDEGACSANWRTS